MKKTQQITADIMQNANTKRTIFRVLVTGISVLSIVYIYLIGSITFNVLARKSLDVTIRTTGAHIGELELTYLNTTYKIDKNFAFEKGFVDIHSPLFATLTAPAQVAIR